VFAWLTSYVLLGERLGSRAGVGAVMILGGILVSELKGASSQHNEELGADHLKQPARTQM